MGHKVGDQVLQTIAKRLNTLARSKDLVARLAGDEFVILIRNTDDMLMKAFKSELNAHLQTLIQAINQPISIQEHELTVGASIGIALIPQDGRTSSQILSHADTAMYQAKALGKNQYQYFENRMQEELDRRTCMIKSLKSALKNSEFELFYQLQVNSITNEYIGMEALLRWKHPIHKTYLSPADFLTVAEESNHIQAIDDWVIQQSISDIALLKHTLNRTIPVSINLSAKKMEDPTLPDTLKTALDAHYLQPNDLRIELTETSLLHNLDQVTQTLIALKNLGIKTSIDDFGTGYSSLSYLQALPVDTLKIDKIFIDKIATSDDDLQICRTIIQLAQNLNKNLVAEGVQSTIQKDILQKEGCTTIQGFLYAKPAPLSEVISRLAEQKHQFINPSEKTKPDPPPPKTDRLTLL